jgi:hypothetical protein
MVRLLPVLKDGEGYGVLMNLGRGVPVKIPELRRVRNLR